MPLEKSQERPSLSENTERLSRPGLRLTDELELRFLENLREHGRTKGTISTYRRNLSKLRKYLPEDSNLDPAFLSSWQSELLEQGYSPGTVNSCTATVNGLLEFAGRRDLQAGQIPINGEVSSPELTRNEYLRLLSAARALGKEQAYLLAKVFANVDLTVQELPQLTVEAVKESRVVISSNSAQRIIYVPATLREELGNYIQCTGILSGPIFVTRSGRQLNRTAVTAAIQGLAHDARVVLQHIGLDGLALGGRLLNGGHAAQPRKRHVERARDRGCGEGELVDGGTHRLEPLLLRHAEALDENGNFYTENLSWAKATDTYILSGGKQTLHPHFTWHGFRYICVEGLQYGQNVQFTACHLSTDLSQTGHFTCSDKRVNRLQQNIQWSQRDNFLDIPTDCPQRSERLGWTGSDVWFAHGIHFNDEELRVLAKTHTGVAHCPISNMKLASGVARVPEMLKLGVPVGLAVDGSASNDGSSLMEELRVAFLLHRLNSSKAAPSGYDVLKMATCGSAAILGRSDDIGSLEVGKCCDLFMIDSRRLELVGSCFDPKSVLGTVGVRGPVDYTVVQGRVTVDHGHLVTVDEEQLAHDAEAKCRAYLNR